VDEFSYLSVVLSEFAGPEEAKNLTGGEVLRLIQIRLAMLSIQKISRLRQS
jgi:hypothetical protein